MHLIPSVRKLLLQLHDRRAGLRRGTSSRSVEVFRAVALVEEDAAVEVLAAPAQELPKSNTSSTSKGEGGGDKATFDKVGG